MEELNALLKEISENSTRLEQLKEQSPEAREALELTAAQERLLTRLIAVCKEQTPQVMPMPYPVPYLPSYPAYPGNPWPWQPWITWSDSTTTTGRLVN